MAEPSSLASSSEVENLCCDEDSFWEDLLSGRNGPLPMSTPCQPSIQIWEAGGRNDSQQQIQNLHIQTWKAVPDQGSSWDFQADTLSSNTEAAVMEDRQQPTGLEAMCSETARGGTFVSLHPQRAPTGWPDHGQGTHTASAQQGQPLLALQDPAGWEQSQTQPAQLDVPPCLTWNADCTRLWRHNGYPALLESRISPLPPGRHPARSSRHSLQQQACNKAMADEQAQSSCARLLASRPGAFGNASASSLHGSFQQPWDVGINLQHQCAASQTFASPLSSGAPADVGPAAHPAIQNRVGQQLRGKAIGQEQHQSGFQSSCQDLAGRCNHQLPTWQLPEFDVSVHQQLEAHLEELMQTFCKQSQGAEAAVPDRLAAEGTGDLLRMAECSQTCFPQPAVSGCPGIHLDTPLHPTTLSCLDGQQPSKGIPAAPHGTPAAAHASPGGSEVCGLLSSRVAGQAMASGNCPAGQTPLHTCSHWPGPLPADDSWGPDLSGHQQPDGALRQLLAIHLINQLQCTGSKRKVCTKPAFASSLHDSPSTSVSSIIS